MADETTIKWLYPSDFTGTYSEYGQTKGHKRHVILCTNVSDGTGEDEVIKVKRSDLLTTDGGVPTKLIIEKIEYDVSGMTVEVSYNNINDEIVSILQDSADVIDFTSVGGFAPVTDDDGEGGDIVFTTSGQTSGSSYNIILTVRPHE